MLKTQNISAFCYYLCIFSTWLRGCRSGSIQVLSTAFGRHISCGQFLFKNDQQTCLCVATLGTAWLIYSNVSQNWTRAILTPISMGCEFRSWVGRQLGFLSLHHVLLLLVKLAKTSLMLEGGSGGTDGLGRVGLKFVGEKFSLFNIRYRNVT